MVNDELEGTRFPFIIHHCRIHHCFSSFSRLVYTASVLNIFGRFFSIKREMKTVKIFIVAVALALFAIACGESTSTNQTATNAGTQPTPAASPKATASASPTPADELAEAKATYSKNCAACHQDNGEGGTVKIDNKPLKVPSLKEGHALKHTDAEFAKQISNGGDGMPPFKDKLTPEQINNLVRFLRRDIQGNAAPKTSDAPARPAAK
jgi:mono/diheme cytochrome c family protein